MVSTSSPNGLNYSFCVFTINEIMAEEVVRDWLSFLSPRPAEVVCVVGYSETIPEFWLKMKEEGIVDQVFGLEMGAKSVHDICIDALLKLFELANHEWIVTTNLDVLPYRSGHEDWLKEMYDVVNADDQLIGATGSFRSMYNQPYKNGFYSTRSFSVNFSLIRKAQWKAIIDRALDLASVDNPGLDRQNVLSKNRFIVEYAVEAYLFISGKRMLIRDESLDWSIFHVNVWNEKLAEVRERYRLRHNVKPYLNRAKPIGQMAWQIPKHKQYYGWPKIPLIRRLRIWLGRLKQTIISR